ncbi:MAG TPA: hypothetical protein VFW39_06390 [Sphingomicrobium sp.]|nr:hypothetical protein [Sphingomicrobium sp.]
MPDYRLYCLNGDRHIAHGEWIDADNDHEAIALVRAKRLGLNCELWEGSRLVAKIVAYVADIAPGPTVPTLPR